MKMHWFAILLINWLLCTGGNLVHPNAYFLFEVSIYYTVLEESKNIMLLHFDYDLKNNMIENNKKT